MIAILLYTAIVFYFGWSVFTWFTNMVQVNPVDFRCCVGIVWTALIIGRIDHRLRLFQVVGAYWMIVMQYGVILFPMFTILIWIFPNQINTNWVGHFQHICFNYLNWYILCIYTSCTRACRLTCRKRIQIE